MSDRMLIMDTQWYVFHLVSSLFCVVSEEGERKRVVFHVFHVDARVVDFLFFPPRVCVCVRVRVRVVSGVVVVSPPF